MKGIFHTQVDLIPHNIETIRLTNKRICLLRTKVSTKTRSITGTLKVLANLRI